MIRLFIEFFKAGLFAIGGGPATIPFLKEMSENYKWFTNEELLDMIAVSESTPGAIGTNMATYVGMKVAGIPGAIVATTALALPSIIIILLIINIINKYRQEEIVINAFYGIRPATAGLVFGAMFEIFVISLLNLDKIKSPLEFFKIGPIILFITIFIIHKIKPKIHPIILIFFGAVSGILFKL